MPSSSLPVFIAVRLAARLVPRSSTQISWGARERTELLAAAPVSLCGDDSILRQVGKGVNVVRQRCGPKLDLSGRASLTFRVKKSATPGFFASQAISWVFFAQVNQQVIQNMAQPASKCLTC
jgi:hypothetical protein